MRPLRRHNLRLLVAGGLAAIVLGAGSTVGLAAASGAFGGSARSGARCVARRWPARWSASP
ncbi:MAG TPA: hypothetical protein VFA45_13035 [Actinomycetes bacterium]|nr:hypothetical protein [Actinomycetes bacterium]